MTQGLLIEVTCATISMLAFSSPELLPYHNSEGNYVNPPPNSKYRQLQLRQTGQCEIHSNYSLKPQAENGLL